MIVSRFANVHGLICAVLKAQEEGGEDVEERDQVRDARAGGVRSGTCGVCVREESLWDWCERCFGRSQSFSAVFDACQSAAIPVGDQREPETRLFLSQTATRPFGPERSTRVDPQASTRFDRSQSFPSQHACLLRTPTLLACAHFSARFQPISTDFNGRRARKRQEKAQAS